MSADGRRLIAIFAGGAAGAVARAGLVALLPARAGHWPWGTFASNAIGTALLAYFTTRLQERLPLSSYRRPLLGTGLCGALTTFSTLQLEVFQMLDAGRIALAVLYALSSVAAGFLLVAVATSLTRRVRTLA